MSTISSSSKILFLAGGVSPADELSLALNFLSLSLPFSPFSPFSVSTPSSLLSQLYLTGSKRPISPLTLVLPYLSTPPLFPSSYLLPPSLPPASLSVASTELFRLSAVSSLQKHSYTNPYNTQHTPPTPLSVDAQHFGSSSLPSSKPLLEVCQLVFPLNIQQNQLRSGQTSLALSS
ncbi:hypothetical protein BGX38DRAFT_1239091 [Terfezia claveryi]|nr:hypothetical protein BGX38DRAFT_1239091 [Terfezia claveryi]